VHVHVVNNDQSAGDQFGDFVQNLLSPLGGVNDDDREWQILPEGEQPAGVDPADPTWCAGDGPAAL